MRKIIIFFIIIFLASNIYSLTFNIKGNNVIWSPVSKTLFLYSVYGKSSGTVIWKMYDLNKKKSSTVYYGNSLLPQASLDGESIIFTKKNVIQLYADGNLKDYSTSVVDLTGFDWGLKGDKIVYSNGEKIYVLQIKDNNNYFVVNGDSPAFIDNDKKIIYLDKDQKVSVIDESLKSRCLIDNVVKEVYPLKDKNSFLFQTDRNIKLYELNNDIICTIVEDKDEISTFNVSYDFMFLTYNNNKGKHYMVHIPTHLKVEILDDKNFFSQKLSVENEFIAFEKSEQIVIKDVQSFIQAFNLGNIYKISLGKKDGLNNGINLEVYQEKKNPFTELTIGYEEQGFKGLVKIITIYEDYSYGMIDKEFSSDKPIEIGDAVLWKEKDKLGSILKK